MACVLDSMNQMPYPEALALSARIDKEFQGLPIAISSFAGLAMRSRRRLAGDIEGVLREDTARLEEGRKTGNVYLQIEALRSLATTYRSFHSLANEMSTLEAAVELQEMLETTMTKETFEKVKQPLLMLYYYRDDVHQDSVVSVPAMLKMFDELGTPAGEKIKEPIPNAGNHVIGSFIKSSDLLSVQTAVENFMVKTLHLTKAPNSSIIEVSK